MFPVVAASQQTGMKKHTLNDNMTATQLILIILFTEAYANTIILMLFFFYLSFNQRDLRWLDFNWDMYYAVVVRSR